MTNSDLISIITPFKNSSQFLNDCLKSIINQTYKKWELIIIDDYSIDDSFQKVYSISQSEKRIKLYKNEGQIIVHNEHKWWDRKPDVSIGGSLFVC